MRRSLVFAPLLVVVLALTACHPEVPSATSTTAPPSPKPTTSVTATPSATPTPTVAPKPVLASVYADGTAMTLTATDGSVIATLDYFQPRDTAIAMLTDALGFAPTQVDKNGTPNSDNTATTRYDFEGLAVLNPPSDGGLGWAFRLNIAVASVRGIPITTVGGAAVGSDAQSLAAAYPDTTRMITTWLRIGIPSSDGYGTVLTADDPSTVITAILTPAGI